ncbi:ATP-binding protein [Chamaesiphon sp. VAR_48_metabat_403]|uniref:ATP-binding protein n=1 Tax=Chamaesiphon sp. VAR_48_metabat_403 TaxID=2964700 RepID=UPI00286EB03A|nr:ATP-binding protein [Chamaesiphon sp. VAR_48_metabat_403]
MSKKTQIIDVGESRELEPDTLLNSRDWNAANHHYLSTAIEVLRNRLECYGSPPQSQPELQLRGMELDRDLEAAVAALPAPSALDRLCQLFNLSTFDRQILLLCVAIEFRVDFGSLFAAVQGNAQFTYPTLGLALAVFPDSDWKSIAPDAPLRHWRLIEIGAGNALTGSPIKLDERILHYILGTECADARLATMVESLTAEAGELVPSHQILADRIAALWRQPRSGRIPVVQLSGAEFDSKKAIAATVCQICELRSISIPAQAIPLAADELDTFIRLWQRETILTNSILYLDCDEFDADAPRARAISRLLHSIERCLFVASRERLRVGQRPVVNFEVGLPHFDEQSQVWHRSIGKLAPEFNTQVPKLVSQFNLSPTTIQAACIEAAGHLHLNTENDLGHVLWDACRWQARPRLDELAQQIPPSADWENLVLPDSQREILREVAAHVRQRITVYQTWGFGAKNSRGLGISALFAGSSGTGKTLAAEVLAQELRLDLYRIDLSSVVSKYIGETEKNLRRVFDAAEYGGAILLFDEADALFGKRSEVKDARDRYANIEVSYLLQRMESYPGLAILTTNLKSAIDPAFLRRIRFVTQFPFPDASQRAEIWRRIFPRNTPTEDLDYLKLGRLNVAGGNIRNIALNGAFLAADRGEAVQMKHILRAAQTEYSKLEKSLTEAEVGGWV